MASAAAKSGENEMKAVAAKRGLEDTEIALSWSWQEG